VLGGPGLPPAFGAAPDFRRSTSRLIPQKEICMEAQDNKQLALKKAISSHEQAAAGLADLMGTLLSEEKYKIMLSRLTQNIAELNEDSAHAKPGDHV
jgi:hypothetical protein